MRCMLRAPLLSARLVPAARAGCHASWEMHAFQPGLSEALRAPAGATRHGAPSTTAGSHVKAPPGKHATKLLLEATCTACRHDVAISLQCIVGMLADPVALLRHRPTRRPDPTARRHRQLGESDSSAAPCANTTSRSRCKALSACWPIRLLRCTLVPTPHRDPASSCRRHTRVACLLLHRRSPPVCPARSIWSVERRRGGQVWDGPRAGGRVDSGREAGKRERSPHTPH